MRLEKYFAVHRHAKKHPHVSHTFLFGVFFAMIVLIALFVFLLAGIRSASFRSDTVVFGITYSKPQAVAFGLDWKDAYLALLDELQVKHLRIPVYWNEMEGVKDWYFFDELDFLVHEAEKRGAKIILAVGRRVPRWPECHIPDWAKKITPEEQEAQVMEFVQKIVERYQDSPSVVMWQVENEPFFSLFGECPETTKKFVASEVELVKNTDSQKRPIMITDSGELSAWLKVSSLADVLGISMYRITWNDYFGHFIYPITPRFYQNKSLYARLFVDKVIVSELQAEPWGRMSLWDFSVDEQLQIFGPAEFRDNVKFARETGFDEVYLWGAEWWYWLHDRGDERMWEEAKKVFEE